MNAVEKTIDLDKLYQERAQAVTKRNQRYLKLLFNDHFVVFLLLVLGSLILGFQSIRHEELSAPFSLGTYWQYGLLAWLVLGLQFGSLVTYFQPADRVFLAAGDDFLTKVYLKKAWQWSLFLAIGWQVLFATLAWPVFQTIGQGRLLDWGAVLLVLLAVKTLMMTVSLNQLISSPSPTKVSTAGQTTWIRLALETVIFAGIIFLPGLGHWLVIGFSLLLALCLSWSWFQRTKKVQGTLALDWTVALASSQKHDQAVWHFYSLFAQVPNQGVVVKRRSYLDRWLSHFSFQKNPARRLFWIKLLRGGDELVLVLRLVVVALVLLLVLPNQASYWQAGGIVLLVYLVNFQLLPVFEQSRSVLWTQLALGSGLQQTKTFLTVLAEITAMVVGLAFVVMLVFAGPLAALVVLGSGTLMGLVLHLLWLPKTLQKKL